MRCFSVTCEHCNEEMVCVREMEVFAGQIVSLWRCPFCDGDNSESGEDQPNG